MSPVPPELQADSLPTEPSGKPQAHYKKWVYFQLGFPGGTVVKNLPDTAGYAGDTGSIPGLGISCGEGNDNPLQYSCLKNSMNRGAWQAAVRGVPKGWMRLNTHGCMMLCMKNWQCATLKNLV